jgi:hypothetical protein
MITSPIIRTSIQRRPARAVVAAAALSLVPFSLLAQSASSTADTPAAGRVGAEAILINTLDANKVQPGADFQARLDGKVRLADGTELPSGTVLHGTVASDDMNVSGKSKLALRFNTAQLKDGKSVPIQAMIVGFDAPSNPEQLVNGYKVRPTDDWAPESAVVDQIGVIGGVDLHSKVDSQNSGVFVATHKDDVRLGSGSAINLAISAEQPGAHTAAGN